jgi:hypothetical protein
MIVMPSVEESAHKYVRNSIRTYLEGRCDLSWILGVSRSSSNQTQVRSIIESCFFSFAATEQYRKLLAEI